MCPMKVHGLSLLSHHAPSSESIVLYQHKIVRSRSVVHGFALHCFVASFASPPSWHPSIKGHDGLLWVFPAWIRSSPSLWRHSVVPYNYSIRVTTNFSQVEHKIFLLDHESYDCLYHVGVSPLLPLLERARFMGKSRHSILLHHANRIICQASNQVCNRLYRLRTCVFVREF